MNPIDRTLVDPSVTDAEIEQAIDGDPAPFIDADAQDDFDDLDEQPAALVSIVPASIQQRCANAKRLRDDKVYVGVSRCLATVRGPILGLPPVYPTAAVAGDNSKPFHPYTDPNDISVLRGSIGFAWNGGAGHVWLELGHITVDRRPDAIVSTTDFHRNGYEGIALRSRMLTWCRATRWGTGETVNGFYVGPGAKPQKPDPAAEFHAWPRDRKITFLRNEAKRRRGDGHPVAARQLDHWADRLAAKR